VSDIFREVDEEVRREQLQRLWSRYGNLVIVLAILIVAGVGGWRAYQWWEAKKAAEAGSQFEAAVALSEQGKYDEARAAFDKLASTGTAGYRSLARFRAAEALAGNDPQAAIKAYDALATDSGLGQTMQDLANVRSGLILVDTAPYDQLLARLEPLTAADRTFRHTARELLALAAWRAGNVAQVKRWVDTIMGDPETPAAVRSRAEMLAAVTSGAEKG
jgi:hypothetical protein